MSQAIRDPAELCRLLQLDPALATAAAPAAADFPLLVPKAYLSRIRPGDPRDPLLLQVLPQWAETQPAAGFSPDPLAEAGGCGPAGLLRKYTGRSLIVTTGACCVHCRFCFRRHLRGTDTALSAGNCEPLVRQLAEDRSVEEVILSGGDPLLLDDALLAEFAARLARLEHLRRLRLHTRLPVMIPSRVDAPLLGWLRATRLAPVVVVHVNHPAEIDAPVAAAFARLVDAGVPLLSQSVLLRGVNDSIDTLAALFGRLVDLRVMPYYLHQLDRVAGAAHFEVPEAEGLALMDQLRRRLPGYAVPRYVRETPGEPCKRLLV